MSWDPSKWRERVQATVDQEGFDYAFTGYSDFSEVNDEKFHELRLAYLAAGTALAEYVRRAQ